MHRFRLIVKRISPFLCIDVRFETEIIGVVARCAIPPLEAQARRQAGRQAGRQTGRQAGTQAGRQAGRQECRQAYGVGWGRVGKVGR